MGLFSNLTGQKSIATIKIKFYGENEASIEYETDVSDQEQKEMDIIQVFALYYSKMLYNLNQGEIADNLILYIKKATSDLIIQEDELKRPSILSSGQKLVEVKESGVTKTYSGELFEKSNKTRIIQTHMDMGGEGYYAPISTVMFLQWLIKNLSDGSLIFLVLSINGMNEFYQKVGNYADIKSLVAAPNYGFSVAGQMLSEIEKEEK
jgi:hypothetical protein